jgi:hypothetical protein
VKKYTLVVPRLKSVFHHHLSRIENFLDMYAEYNVTVISALFIVMYRFSMNLLRLTVHLQICVKCLYVDMNVKL